MQKILAELYAGQRAGTVRALYAAVEALEKAERFERRKRELPAKTGEPWTEDEDRRLLAGFDAGRGLPELAAPLLLRVVEERTQCPGKMR